MVPFLQSSQKIDVSDKALPANRRLDVCCDGGNQGLIEQPPDSDQEN